MTKDEIFKEEYGKLIANPDKAYAQHPSIITAAHIAMEQYAKQQAMSFGEYVDVHAVRNGFHEWTVGIGNEKKTYTSEELYGHFLLYQKNKTEQSK